MKKACISQVAGILIILILGLTLTGCGQSDKEVFPSSSLQMNVPWGAGGGTDRIARMLGVALEEELGQTVNIVNRTGGGGTVGHLAGAQATPDGYSFTLATVEFTMYNGLGQADISYKDFDAIALVNLDPMAIAVRADSPYQSIEDLNNAIKENPGVLKSSGAGHAGINHLARSGWLNIMGLDSSDMPWIPSPDGSAQAIQELIAGGVDVVITSLAEFQPMIEAGKIRALAVMGEERNPAYPEIPTLKEKDLDWVVGTWRALVSPSGVPQDTLNVLRDAAREAINSESFRDFMETNNFQILYKDGEECNDFMKEQEESLTRLLDLL